MWSLRLAGTDSAADRCAGCLFCGAAAAAGRGAGGGVAPVKESLWLRRSCLAGGCVAGAPVATGWEEGRGGSGRVDAPATISDMEDLVVVSARSRTRPANPASHRRTR